MSRLEEIRERFESARARIAELKETYVYIVKDPIFAVWEGLTKDAQWLFAENARLQTENDKLRAANRDLLSQLSNAERGCSNGW